MILGPFDLDTDTNNDSMAEFSDLVSDQVTDWQDTTCQDDYGQDGEEE